MNFYISKIRLWFRDGEKPRDLDFYNDKVNVITGDSSTGKSSVLKIIDYCLLSERSTIVEDVINENVSWYGMVFYVDEAPYTIIRQAPTIESAEMTVIFKEGVFLPSQPVAGMKDIRSKAMVKMNELFHIPQKIKLESKVKLHFRHNLLFNYLTEDIIATENTYQDTRFFRREEYEKVLGDLFKMAIGVNEMQQRELESALQKARKEANGKREVQNFQDYRTMELFRNFVAFVMEMIDTTEEGRKEFSEEVAEKANDSSGNVIVNMIDRLDNIHKQKVFANLSKARINKELSIEDFFRLHSILVRIPYVDLESLSNYSKPYYDHAGDSELLFATGALKLASISPAEENLYVLSHLGESLLEFGLKKKVEVERVKGTQMDVSGAVLDDKNLADSIKDKANETVNNALEFQIL